MSNVRTDSDGPSLRSEEITREPMVRRVSYSIAREAAFAEQAGQPHSVSALSQRNRLLYLFVHIPKTAGQTLRDHFIKHLDFHETFVHLGTLGAKDARQHGLGAFAKRTPEQRNRAYVILGHGVSRHTSRLVQGKEQRFITFLRDPAERLVSQYNFQMHRRRDQKGMPTIPFPAWYERKRPDNVIRWLYRRFPDESSRGLRAGERFERVRDVLDRFWFVGTVETFDHDSAYLMRQLGLPPIESKSNVTGVRFERRMSLTDEWRDRIYEDNPHDLRLYRIYRQRRQSAVDQLSTKTP